MAYKMTNLGDAIGFYMPSILKTQKESNMRMIHEIANEIKQNWQPVNYAAMPYLNAMYSLTTLDDNYGMDSARSVVLYFLSNATTWRGDVARRVKKELNDMLSAHRKARLNRS